MRLSSNLSLFLYLPVLSGIILWLAWPPFPTPFLVFIGFVPLLIAEKQISSTIKKRTGLKVWLSLYLGLVIWNITTTWWVGIASVVGGLFANLANPALMTIPFMLSRKVRKHLGNKIGYTSLVFFWLSFEYLHLRWEFTWPWLALGNAFASQHTWIQWYEYTGVFGGTLWIWIVNLLVFFLIDKLFLSKENKSTDHKSIFKKYQPQLIIFLLIIVPIIISLNIYAHVKEKGIPVNVTVLQPNFDPYEEKFDMPYRLQMSKMTNLSLQKITDTTDYLVWPETSIQDNIWINRINSEKPVRDLKKIVDSFPQLTIIAGINGFEKYDSKENASPTAREGLIRSNTLNAIDTMYYDVYNTSIQVDSTDYVPYYHKSKLVPGVERMPYPKQMKFLEKLTINLGGITGSLGTQKERTVFYNHDSIGVGTAICYESIFGEYVSDYVKNGADLMFIITNDGWWGNTSGYKQHCMYGKLRAIENRRSIARSANTGISCFINQRGDISQATGWREDAVLNETIFANKEFTFYTLHGDYIARAAVWMTAFLLSLTIIKALIRRNKND